MVNPKSNTEPYSIRMKVWLFTLMLDLKVFFHSEHRIAQYHNQLTDEIYFYIEKRTLWWWKEVVIKNSVYQQKFGCDEDGMFNNIEKAQHIIKFLRGELRIVKTLRDE